MAKAKTILKKSEKQTKTAVALPRSMKEAYELGYVHSYSSILSGDFISDNEMVSDTVGEFAVENLDPSRPDIKVRVRARFEFIGPIEPAE